MSLWQRAQSLLVMKKFEGTGPPTSVSPEDGKNGPRGPWPSPSMVAGGSAGFAIDVSRGDRGRRPGEPPARRAPAGRRRWRPRGRHRRGRPGCDVVRLRGPGAPPSADETDVRVEERPPRARGAGEDERQAERRPEREDDGRGPPRARRDRPSGDEPAGRGRRPRRRPGRRAGRRSRSTGGSRRRAPRGRGCSGPGRPARRPAPALVVPSRLRSSDSPPDVGTPEPLSKWQAPCRQARRTAAPATATRRVYGRWRAHPQRASRHLDGSHSLRGPGALYGNRAKRSNGTDPPNPVSWDGAYFRRAPGLGSSPRTWPSAICCSSARRSRTNSRNARVAAGWNRAREMTATVRRRR